MLRNSIKPLLRQSRVSSLFAKRVPAAIRLYSEKATESLNDPKVTSTNLYSTSDPTRAHMFAYTWGTWLKEDEREKAMRFTPFSLQGLDELIKKADAVLKSDAISKEDPDQIKHLNGKINLLCNNVTRLFENTKLGNIKQVISLHEGKHHRVYEIVIENGEKDTKFILRLPYTLDSQLFTKRKIESEVATMDYLSAALGLKIPRVIAYSGDVENQLGHPFILMEHIDDVESSLMKLWNPLIDSANDSLQDKDTKEVLDQVVDPIADFMTIVNGSIFDAYGSIYFKDDCPTGVPALEGQDRWVIGPTVERAYYRNKRHVPQDVLDQHVGPWKRNEPFKMVKDLIDLELHNLKIMLSMVDAQTIVENRLDLESAISVYEKFQKIAGHLFNMDAESSVLPHLEELLKPRLNVADLDPMNVLVKKDEYSFLDFENSSIKPFLLTTYPKFIEYNGAKIFNLREEVENYDELDDLEKEQYKFMFKRTRNQFIWELALNNRSKELLGVISPAVKLIKSPYVNALELRSIKDYLYVQHGLIELSTMWDTYSENGILPKVPNPIKFTDEELKLFQEKLNDYQIELSGTPFAATGGWVPQDMFNNLLKQNMVVKDGENWKIDTEKVLE